MATARAALVLSLLALIASMTPLADAQKKVSARTAAAIKLTKGGKIPANRLPTVKRATRAENLQGQQPDDLTGSCAPTTVDLGTWCLSTAPYPTTNEEAGKTDYAFATQKCVELGGYLPTAAQLIGAADAVKLASTIDDDQVTASIDLDASDGLKDRREMSATLITTAAGSSAAGTQGVSDGSRGDPKQGEPDPTPLPANPYPETLQYVTVYDNGNKGGFAGGRPVTASETFRCAFNKVEGASKQGEE
jgi:hypothetical protein